MENSTFSSGVLPVTAEKELLAMNQLMMDPRYKIKPPANFLRMDRSDKVNPDFISYTLNDYLGHLQKCVASTKKMMPAETNVLFYEGLAKYDAIAFNLVSVTRSIDIKTLGTMLSQLQKSPREVTVVQLIPFVGQLYQSLIRVYYLGAPGIAKKYRILYSFILKELLPADPESLKLHTSSAIAEWYYIFDQMSAGLYPLVLRMVSPVMLTQNQLFYANGSRVLSWLQVSSSEVLILKEGEPERSEMDPSAAIRPPPPSTVEPAIEVPRDVLDGIAVLDRFFPEAGWTELETMPDMCPYFQPILQFQDAFSQLAPDNPLQVTLILLLILEELFQGLRLIKFVPLQPLSAIDETEDIYKILEEWILYQEIIFDKNFSTDLKEYTHQIYTQPEYNKAPYGRTQLSNMYTLIKTTFLPYFDIRLYGTAKIQKDDRLPPFYLRVRRLKRLLDRYHDEVRAAPPGSDVNTTGSLPGIQNPWAQYKFDIPNSVSKRLDALCGGKHSKSKTNALLIRYTLSILSVLDWWINDKNSYAYQNTPDYLYRVTEPGKSVPAFGIKARTDVDALFLKHLKARNGGIGSQE